MLLLITIVRSRCHSTWVLLIAIVWSGWRSSMLLLIIIVWSRRHANLLLKLITIVRSSCHSTLLLLLITIVRSGCSIILLSGFNTTYLRLKGRSIVVVAVDSSWYRQRHSSRRRITITSWRRWPGQRRATRGIGVVGHVPATRHAASSAQGRKTAGKRIIGHCCCCSVIISIH